MKPEARLIKSVHDLVNTDVYREKMFNPMRGGTPDCFYMGFQRMMWIEWKWVPKFPKVIKPKLSPLQRVWLMRAWDRGQLAFAVVGSPTGCIVFATPIEWVKGVARDKAQVLSKQQISKWIQDKCGLDHLVKQPSEQSISTPSSSSAC
jgi:hypothetical protein